MQTILDSKVHGANMGPILGRQDQGGPHVGPMNFAIWDKSGGYLIYRYDIDGLKNIYQTLKQMSDETMEAASAICRLHWHPPHHTTFDCEGLESS